MKKSYDWRLMVTSYSGCSFFEQIIGIEGSMMKDFGIKRSVLLGDLK